MRICPTGSLLAIATVAASLMLVDETHAQAPTRSAAAGDFTIPRTADGRPDFQGNWTNASLTPLERPRDASGPTLSWDEVARLEQGAVNYREAGLQPSDPDRPPPPVGGDGSTGAAGGVGGYNRVYIESGDRVAVINGEPRSAFVVDPPDGRVPATTEAARAAMVQSRARFAGFGQYDHPELRPIGERCILSFGSNAGPPMLPNGFYNNNYTIVQTPDHVVILTEMIHDARIIQIGDGPRLPSDVRPYFGDSRGWWEGDTLVIETTNIHPEQRFRNLPSDHLKVTERLSWMEDGSGLFYTFTIEDPVMYERPWTAELPFYPLEGRVYEYACHEGNYSLSNVLSGARYEERQAAEAAANSTDRR